MTHTPSLLSPVSQHSQVTIPCADDTQTQLHRVGTINLFLDYKTFHSSGVKVNVMILSCLNVIMRRTKFTIKYFVISSSFPGYANCCLCTQFEHLFPHWQPPPSRRQSNYVVPSRLYHTDSGLLKPVHFRREENKKTKYFRLRLVWLGWWGSEPEW